jgi:hypothetical protein
MTQAINMWSRFAVAAAAAALGACSGGDDRNGEEGQPVTTPPPPARGSLIEPPPPRVASISAAELNALLNATAEGRLLTQFISAPRCGVDVHQLRYNSVDVGGTAITASGALMIPTGADAACQGPRPLVTYAHGTQVERAFNIANLTDSNNVEGLLMAVAFTARGYIVVAPNYAGFDTSSLAHHPFLNAEQQANDVVDALAAARSALPTSFAPTVSDSGKLFITGYSQGGYVAMAAHRLLQQNGAVVTASAPMSGPYSLAAFGDAVFYGQVVRSAPLFVTYLATGYERAYGDIYGAPTEMLEARYATGVDTLLPTAGRRSELFAQGRLPAEQLFSSTPPEPAYAPYTPPTSPADLAPVFARGFGAENLVTNAFRLAYLQDAQARPDGGFPTVTDGLPASAPENGLRRAFKTNDLRTWTPTAPVLLCAGNEDPTVLYLNTDLMQRYWAANGAANVTVLDLDADLSLSDPYAARKAGFAAAKAAVAADAASRGADPALAVAEAYHSALVPPFCLSAVQSFFDER